MQKNIFTNIVVAISGSNASVHAAKYAILLAKHYKCHITAIYVVDTATIRQLALSKIFVYEEGLEYEENLTVNGKRYLTFVKELAKAKGIKIKTELRSGTISVEIVNVAVEKNADLIILGGWEKESKAQVVISNVHLDIMSNAKCSVLISKEPFADQMYRQI